MEKKCYFINGGEHKVAKNIAIKAAELMKNQDKKLETISFLVGYDDYNYFSRVFRKKVGCSPREYRNKFTQL